MPISATPRDFYIQQGNGQAYLTWSFSTGATSYSINRSIDGTTFAEVGTSSVNNYLDTTTVIGTLYYYQVASVNGTGTSSYTDAASVIPTYSGDLSLGQTRLMAQQVADRENSNFVTMPEWNSYIMQSYYELYDLLIDTYEDYYIAAPITFTTNGSDYQYDLPNGANYEGAPPFYKLTGVDCGLSSNNDAYVTINQFNFIDRNRYTFPSLGSTYLGVFNLQYRLVGDKLHFIPAPSGGQIIRVWYIPRLTQLLQDTDILKGISGWSEYVIVDAAIKALRKEESDVSVLMAQKMMLKKRIEESASNRDAGQATTISDVRGNSGNYSGSGSGSGPGAGW